MSQNVPSESSLPPNQERALLALLSCSSLKSVAKTAGVDRRTLFRWLREPDFAAAYREARREVVEQATAQLQRESANAVAVLADVMYGKPTRDLNPPAARASAAKIVLEFALRAVELDDVAARLDALESKVNP